MSAWEAEKDQFRVTSVEFVVQLVHDALLPGQKLLELRGISGDGRDAQVTRALDRRVLVLVVFRAPEVRENLFKQ